MKRSKMLLKVLSFSLIIVLLMTACSQAGPTKPSESPSASPKPSPSGSASPEQSADGPLTKFDPPINASILFPWDPNSTVKDNQTNENNMWLDLFHDQLGVKINYPSIVEQSQYTNKINLTIASGDLPDIFRVNASQLKQLVEADQVEDLSTVYETYASELLRNIMTEGGVPALSAASFDGKLMAIPSTNSAILNSKVLWIRTDWLKALNLPEPTNMADVLAISTAFTKQDPDKDGRPNTFGLAATMNIYEGQPDLTGFFNSFHAYPNIWVKDGSGKIVYGSVQPEMKAALAELQRMYKAGEIDKEFGVKKGGELNEDITSGKQGMFYGQWWAPVSPLQTLKNVNPESDWKAFPYLSIDDKPAQAAGGFPISNYYVVKKGYKHPEALIKMMNLYMEKYEGESADPNYFSKPDGTQTSKFSPFSIWTMKGDIRQGRIMGALEKQDKSGLTLEEQGYYDQILAYRAGDNTMWNVEYMYGEHSAVPIQNQYAADGRILLTAFYGAPTASMSQKWDSLRTMEIETITQIILGSKSVDSFDEFVKSWNSLGGDVITQEVNETMKNK